MNLGSADQVDAAALSTALVELAGVTAADLQKIDLRATHSYVFVETPVAEKLLAGSGKDRAGKAVRIERPRKKR